jgi:hypothetical protein
MSYRDLQASGMAELEGVQNPASVWERAVAWVDRELSDLDGYERVVAYRLAVEHHRQRVGFDAGSLRLAVRGFVAGREAA